MSQTNHIKFICVYLFSWFPYIYVALYQFNLFTFSYAITYLPPYPRDLMAKWSWALCIRSRMWETGWTPMDFVRGLGPFGCLATGKPRETQNGSLMEDLSKCWRSRCFSHVLFFPFSGDENTVDFPVTSMVLSRSLGLRWLPSHHHMLVGFLRCVSHITYGFQQPRIQSCYLEF